MLNETYRAMLGHKSVIRETFMYGKQRAAEIGYENVFDYSLGNPSVPCPDKFTKAMQTLLAEEEPVALHGYCPSQGDPGFRTAVAAHLAKTFGLPYEQKDIFPTTGAAGAAAASAGVQSAAARHRPSVSAPSLRFISAPPHSNSPDTRGESISSVSASSSCSSAPSRSQGVSAGDRMTALVAASHFTSMPSASATKRMGTIVR